MRSFRLLPILVRCAGPFLALLVFGWTGPVPAQSVTTQRIAAVVNDDVVSIKDLNNRLQLVMISSGIPESAQARERLAPQVLRGLIEETLQLQEAERLDITVTDEEIQRALENIAQRNNLTVEEMRNYLVANGVEIETLLRQLRAQIAWVKVVNRQIRPRVSVTVDQLEMAVLEAQQNLGEPELLLSEIVLPVDSPEQEETVARDAARLVQTVREGASFESLARQVSVAASAGRGGDVGWVSASAIPPELLGALEQMAPGEISPPIRSPVGYHVFWLRDRRLTRGPQLDDGAADVEVRLTQILFPANGNSDVGALSGLRARAAELRDRLEDCGSMVEVAEELAAPASGELGWLKIGDLPPALGRAVLELPVGEVSAPLDGPRGIHLLMVCDRRDPRPAAETTPEREEIAQRLEDERIERLARRYLRDLRAQAFVEVRI